MGDGFLGDHLSLQIIATTNRRFRTSTRRLPALGRLMGSRHFSRLHRDDAQRLAVSRGLQLPEQPDYSLPEIISHAALGEPERRTEARPAGLHSLTVEIGTTTVRRSRPDLSY